MTGGSFDALRVRILPTVHRLAVKERHETVFSMCGKGEEADQGGEEQETFFHGERRVWQAAT